MLTPGSLSLMKGGLPLAASPSRVSSTFLAETLPWVIFLSSWGGTGTLSKALAGGSPGAQPCCGAVGVGCGGSAGAKGQWCLEIWGRDGWEPRGQGCMGCGRLGAMGIQVQEAVGTELRGSGGTWWGGGAWDVGHPLTK